MEVDSDHEYNSDTDSTSNSRGAKVSPLPPISTVIPPGLLATAGLDQPLQSTRPQIIVSPRKIAAAVEAAAACLLNNKHNIQLPPTSTNSTPNLMLPALNLLPTTTAIEKPPMEGPNTGSTIANSQVIGSGPRESRGSGKSVIVRAVSLQHLLQVLEVFCTGH